MPRKKEPTFEEKLGRLRELVELLEDAQMPLKETFAAYEEGVQLLGELERMLSEGERRIEEMSKDGLKTDITGDVARTKEG